MNSKTITREQLCKLFDHTNLKAFADRAAFEQLCQEAKENQFAMVAINSSAVGWCKEFLAGTDVNVGAAISFPLGQTTLATKLFETQNAIDNGADEIDYVINIGELKNQNYDYIRQEMKEIVAVCRKHGVISKVIFENCYLTKEEIIKVAEIAKEIEPDFIKTSTGMATSGANVEDVKLMKRVVGGKVKVKASGGIRSWKDAKDLIDAGVERIGTSSSFKILEEFSIDKDR